jgi:2-haloacid dehalogenase
MLDFSRFRVITFDCYGTLIDWESGLFSAIKPVLAAHRAELSDVALLELYSELEAGAEQGEFHNYRDVLQTVMQGFGQRLGFTPTPAETRSLPDSVAQWSPFPDIVAALSRLATRFRLAIISNVDDELFRASAQKLQVPFDAVITAQQARCYKPDLRIFKLALDRIGVPPPQVLHVGQSIYHDVIPAQSLGLATVWVNRPSPRRNAGAVKVVPGKPDVEVHSLQSLAELAVPKPQPPN